MALSHNPSLSLGVGRAHPVCWAPAQARSTWWGAGGGNTILKQCHSPEGRGRVLCPLHISGLSRFPGAPPAWLPIPIYLCKPPALRGEHTLLQKAKPSPCFCFPWCLMICICRIETGKQYINVCANFPSLLHLLPLFTFYLYRMCAV